MAMMKCNACGWLVPHDRIGIALMQAHLDDKHPITLVRPATAVSDEDQGQ